MHAISTVDDCDDATRPLGSDARFVVRVAARRVGLLTRRNPRIVPHPVIRRGRAGQHLAHEGRDDENEDEQDEELHEDSRMLRRGYGAVFSAGGAAGGGGGCSAGALGGGVDEDEGGFGVGVDGFEVDGFGLVVVGFAEDVVGFEVVDLDVLLDDLELDDDELLRRVEELECVERFGLVECDGWAVDDAGRCDRRVCASRDSCDERAALADASDAEDFDDALDEAEEDDFDDEAVLVAVEFVGEAATVVTSLPPRPPSKFFANMVAPTRVPVPMTAAVVTPMKARRRERSACSLAT